MIIKRSTVRSRSPSSSCYRDVHIFAENVRSVAQYRGEQVVRSQFHNSLRGAALQWYHSELSSTERDLLRNCDIETGWLRVLVKRFKPSPAQAVKTLEHLHYGPAQVSAGVTPAMFTQDVIQACKSAGMPTRQVQLLQAWNKLDPNYKLSIPMPTENTETSEWISIMEERYIVWREQEMTHRSQRPFNALVVTSNYRQASDVDQQVENPSPNDEPRLTFNYAPVLETMPGNQMELSSKVHDYLSNPRHKVFFSADIKHGYFAILVHPNDRHYFAFFSRPTCIMTTTSLNDRK